MPRPRIERNTLATVTASRGLESRRVLWLWAAVPLASLGIAGFVPPVFFAVSYVLTTHAHDAVANARDRRKQRARARALIAKDPQLAVEAGIGRPDIAARTRRWRLGRREPRATCVDPVAMPSRAVVMSAVVATSKSSGG